LEVQRDAARRDAGRIAGLQEHLGPAHAKGQSLGEAEFDQRLSIDRRWPKVVTEAKDVAVYDADHNLEARLGAAEKNNGAQLISINFLRSRYSWPPEGQRSRACFV
jgi:hypothetical protein